MATITIPMAVQRYFPHQIEPSQLWVRYNPEADALIIYFTGQPVPSVWESVDLYASIGSARDDEMTITGVMIEHFSKWLLMPDHADQALQPA